MSEPEVKLEVDEYGRISCRVTNESELLSKDEKELIINHILHLQAENAKLRTQLVDATESMGRVEERCAKLQKLALTLAFCANDEADCDQCPMNGARCDVVQQCFCDGVAKTLREIGIEVSV